jgi:hypothetical protein
MRNRFQNLVIGEERSGKTYFLEYACKNYPGIALAYNYSNPGDYQSFKEVDFLTISETAKAIKDKQDKRHYLNAPYIAAYRYKGRVYSIADFSRMFKGQNVRARRLVDKQSENLLFHAFYQYLSNCHLVIDDSRPIFRNGLKAGHADLLSRKNHTGDQAKGAHVLGCDVSIVLHQIDLINPELWAYSDFMLLFRTNNEPSFKYFSDQRLIEVITQASRELKNAPKYSFFQIGLKGLNYCKTKLLRI